MTWQQTTIAFISILRRENHRGELLCNYTITPELSMDQNRPDLVLQLKEGGARFVIDGTVLKNSKKKTGTTTP